MKPSLQVQFHCVSSLAVFRGILPVDNRVRSQFGGGGADQMTGHRNGGHATDRDALLQPVETIGSGGIEL